VVEVDKGVSPDVLVNFVPRDNLPCMLGKHEQHGELLRLELYRDAALPQLAVDGIKLKWGEANYALLGTWRGHANTAMQMCGCMLLLRAER